jgi:DNA excision repair protein ERCC-2
MSADNGINEGRIPTYQAHEKLRTVQIEMISESIAALEERGAIVAAAPTGVGKTAAALSAALEISRRPGHERTIMFMTGRQSQHRIVVETVREINLRLPAEEPPVTLIDMIGQSGMCVQPFANEHPALFTSLCSEARADAKCRPFLASTKAIGNLALARPLHVHELVKMSRDYEENGQSTPVCPWKVGRELAKHADIIVCDYNHLFNESVRSASIGGMQLELEDLIVIIDEAHNLPDRIRNGLELKLTPDMVRNATFEVDEYLQTMESAFGDSDVEVVEMIRWAHNVVTRLRPTMRAWFRKLGVEVAANEGKSPADRQREVSISEFHDLMNQAFDARATDKAQTTLTVSSVSVDGQSEGMPAGEVAGRQDHDEDGKSKGGTSGGGRANRLPDGGGPPAELRLRRLAEVLQGVEITREADEIQDLAAHRLGLIIAAVEQFGHTSALALVFEDNSANGVITSHLLDPSLVSGTIFSKVAGSILMSGTLYPPELYSMILGLAKNTVLRSFDSPFMNDRRPVAIASDVNGTHRHKSEAMTVKIQSHIAGMVNSCDGHIAVFAPSYARIAEYVAGHNWGNIKVVMEERTWGKQRTDRLLDDLEDARRRGKRLLLAGVFAGKLAEGIDYRNNILDAVVCIGIPMAPPSVEGKALLKYFDDKFGRGKGMRWAMVQPPMNAVLQAMGRPIRSIEDRAFILLLDERHQRGNYQACLPDNLSPIISHDGATTQMIAKRFFAKTKPAE